MTSAALHLRYSFAEYADFEREAHERHEFVDGLILAMAGGTLEHSRLATAVIGSLMAQLKGRPCVVLESNARVRVAATGNAYYPDVTVVCEKMERDGDDLLALTNPAVLVEVLSPSTADYDRTDKLGDYQRIPGLEHVVHVWHDTQRIDVWTRSAADWHMQSFSSGERAALEGVKCELDVAEIYRDPLAALPP